MYNAHAYTALHKEVKVLPSSGVLCSSTLQSVRTTLGPPPPQKNPLHEEDTSAHKPQHRKNLLTMTSTDCNNNEDLLIL